MNNNPWVLRDGCLILYCHLQPGARRTAIQGLHDQRIKIQVQSPALEGRANKALIAFLAKLCHCPKNRICITHGETSRLKTVRIEGMQSLPEEIFQLQPAD